MKVLKLSLLSLAFLSFLCTSCKKDDPKPPAIAYQQPSFGNRTDVIEVPAGLNTLADNGDYNAYAAMSYLNLANAISSFSTSFSVPDDAQKQSANSNSLTYYWSYYGYSYWITYKKESDKYTWKWEYEFPEVSRFTYVTAEQSLDGKSGSWSIYDPENTNNLVWTYTWSLATNGDYTASLVWHDSSTESESFDVSDNADGSGTFTYNLNGVKQAEIIWNADGSGTYWMLGYDGNVTGSWTATK